MLLDEKGYSDLLKIQDMTLELTFLANRANEIAHFDLAQPYNIKINSETIRILGDKDRVISYVSKYYEPTMTNGEAIEHYIEDLKMSQNVLVDWIENGGYKE